MILDVSRRSNMLRQIHDIGYSAHIVERSLSLQLFRNRHEIYRFVIHVERTDGRVDFLMTRLVEGLGSDDLGDDREGILVNHERTKNDALYVSGLWLQVTISTVYGCR